MRAGKIEQTLDLRGKGYDATVRAEGRDSTFHVAIAPTIGERGMTKSQVEYCVDEVDGVVKDVQEQSPWGAFMKRSVGVVIRIADE